jgi:hypothetical protein
MEAFHCVGAQIRKHMLRRSNKLFQSQVNVLVARRWMSIPFELLSVFSFSQFLLSTEVAHVKQPTKHARPSTFILGAASNIASSPSSSASSSFSIPSPDIVRLSFETTPEGLLELQNDEGKMPSSV